MKLVVRTVLNRVERQNYPISDMIFRAQQLVSHISHDMTLLPGDLVCGTSIGVGAMKELVNTVTIAIDGIDVLTNEFRQQAPCATSQACKSPAVTRDFRMQQA